jgi:hypothetical protein
MGILVDADGKIASELVVGAQQVLALAGQRQHHAASTVDNVGELSPATDRDDPARRLLLLT